MVALQMCDKHHLQLFWALWKQAGEIDDPLTMTQLHSNLYVIGITSLQEKGITELLRAQAGGQTRRREKH